MPAIFEIFCLRDRLEEGLCLCAPFGLGHSWLISKLENRSIPGNSFSLLIEALAYFKIIFKKIRYGFLYVDSVY